MRRVSENKVCSFYRLNPRCTGSDVDLAELTGPLGTNESLRNVLELGKYRAAFLASGASSGSASGPASTPRYRAPTSQHTSAFDVSDTDKPTDEPSRRKRRGAIVFITVTITRIGCMRI